MQNTGVLIIALLSFSLYGFSEGTYFVILVPHQTHGERKIAPIGKEVCPTFLLVWRHDESS